MGANNIAEKIKHGEVLSNAEGREVIAQQAKGRKRAKYGSRQVKTKDGTFDSEKEYGRWLLLKSMQEQVEPTIRNLRHHVPYEFKYGGVLICIYESDFVYEQKRAFGWVEVVEDVKGMRRETYIKDGKKKHKTNDAYERFLIKKRLMKAFYNIDVQEV